MARDPILVARNTFHVRVANSQESHREIGALIKRMYSWRGYDPAPNPAGNHISLQARRGEQTLGTLSLNLDSDCGMLADGLYPREVDDMRRKGAFLCELTGLAISGKSGSNELLATLFHLLHIFGRYRHRATDALIEINPRHALYYQERLGFRQIGEARHCRRVNAPAVLLHIRSDFVEEQIARHAGCPKPSDRSLYSYFFPRPEVERLSQRMLEMSCLRHES